MATAERRAALQAQYFFFCECSACMSNQGEAFDPTQERLWALRCASCSGPLLHEAPGREPAGSKKAQTESQNSHFMVCDACGSHQPISSLVRDAFSALGLFKTGTEISPAIKLLTLQCCILKCNPRNLLYKVNFSTKVVRKWKMVTCKMH